MSHPIYPFVETTRSMSSREHLNVTNSIYGDFLQSNVPSLFLIRIRLLIKRSIIFKFPVMDISCTIVIKFTNGQYGAHVQNQASATIFSTNLFAISISPFYLFDRQDGTMSIMVESLICALREHISQPSIQLRPLFRDSIQGLSPIGTATSLATTRVPDFGNEMECPHTGYQELFFNTNSPSMQYSGVVFDPNREIMSMAPVSSHNSSKLADFTRMWQTVLQPVQHFFLIFQIYHLDPCESTATFSPLTSSQ